MIKRAPRPESNFYVLDKRISEDRRLSWAARGMLIYLLGKPDHWQVSPADLINETKDCKRSTGRDGVYAALSELKEAGYLHTIGRRRGAGTFAGADYLVTETPHTEKPEAVVLPYPANPPYTEKPEAVPHTEKPEAVAPVSVQPKNAKTELNQHPAPHTEKPELVDLPYPANPTQVSTDKRKKQELKIQRTLRVVSSPLPVFDVSDVDPGVWQDFLILRKAKKAPITKTAVDGLRREAEKAGWSLDAAIRECCIKGWSGFKADWLLSKASASKPQSFKAQDESLARSRWEALTGQTHPDNLPAPAFHVVDSQFERIAL